MCDRCDEVAHLRQRVQEPRTDRDEETLVLLYDLYERVEFDHGAWLEEVNSWRD